MRVPSGMSEDLAPACAQNDLSARLRPFLLVWGAPILAAIMVGALAPAWAAAAWSAAFAWMGAACLVNASRCGRLHCYFSGPTLLLGALIVGLIGLRLIALGAHGLLAVVGLTLTVAGLTFVLERVWGKYV